MLTGEVLAPGKLPGTTVSSGAATTIATGGMLPRGADAVLMIEHSDLAEGTVGTAETRLKISRAVSPGENVTVTGTDIWGGETVLRAGQVLTSREIGVLAAIGRAEIPVFHQPRVAILSTGDEIVAPGGAAPPGTVFDSNSAILAAAVRELGGK